MSRRVSRPWWMRGALAALCLSTLPACAHPIQTVATSSTVAAPTAGNIGCVEFERGSFDRLHDTLPTIAFVKKYDAARDKVCGKGK